MLSLRFAKTTRNFRDPKGFRILQLHPTINADKHPSRFQSQTLKDQPAPSTQISPPASPAMQIEPGFEDRQEPSVMMGSDDTVILPDSPIQVTDSGFDALMYGQISMEKDKTA